MKKVNILIPAMTLLLMASCNGTSCKQENANTIDSNTTAIQASPEELSGIQKALDLYIEASVKGDSKIAEPAFAQTATLSFADKGKLISQPIKALFDYYDQTGAQPASYKITACHVAVDVAVVCIDSKFGNTRYDDMFTLVKDGSDWKIISKIYHEKNNAE